MRTVRIRKVEIGTGQPKIAVSIMGETLEAVCTQAQAARLSGADVAEWRIDSFRHGNSPEAVADCLPALRAALCEMPLLATFRTQREGGCLSCSTAAYRAVNEAVIASGCADLLDLELFTEPQALSALLTAARHSALPVVLSNHDFEKTPPQEELVQRFRRMRALGGDLLKLAVMPHNRGDVLALLGAAAKIHEETDRPLIAISMGPLGAISRICGGYFGSVMTFAAAAQSSAPGQIPVQQLSTLLKLLESSAPQQSC